LFANVLKNFFARGPLAWRTPGTAEVVKQGIVGRLSDGHLRKVLKKRPYSRTAVAIG